MPRPLLLALAALFAAPAAAQEGIPSHCIALAAATPGVEVIQKAAFGEPLVPGRVRLTYVDHATFLLETPGGLVAVTDYTGYLGGHDVVPDVVTMNNAHSTHWTANPDPRIPHVLQGWGEGERACRSPPGPWRDAGAQRHDRRTRGRSAKARGPTAIRSSSSRWRACASAILATCTRSPAPRNMR